MLWVFSKNGVKRPLSKKLKIGFRPSLSYHLSLLKIFDLCIFSDRFTQVLQYIKMSYLGEKKPKW